MVAASAAGIQAATPTPAAAVTLTQVDGGPDYYARFSHGLPTSRSYFPIAVFLESVLSQADIDKDKDAGLNLYVTLTANSDLNLVRANGMRAILQQSEWRNDPAARANPAAVGWELYDEVDMQLGPGAGYDAMAGTVASLPNDGRMRWNNYGKGVMFWESDAEAAAFLNNYQHVQEADVYWFTDPFVHSASEGGHLFGLNRDLTYEETRRAANYGATVHRLRGLIDPPGSKPVWNVIEVGWPFTETEGQGARQIEPAEIRAAVWQSIIAGARGILYFNHSFGGPNTTQHALRDPAYASERAVVESVNAQITDLAPVLNSPTVSSGWSQRAGTTAMVKWAGATKAKAKKKCKSKKKKKKKKCKKAKGKKAKAKKKCKSKKKKKCKKAKGKKAGGHLYVFAGSAGSPVEGRFSLPCVGNAQAAVVGENRTIPVRGGSFTDHFADGNAIHIYRINDGPKCGLPRVAKVAQAGLAGGADPATSPITVSRAIVAAIVVLLAGMLAFFRLGHARHPLGMSRRRLGPTPSRDR
jgi:hypothetical protein